MRLPIVVAILMAGCVSVVDFEIPGGFESKVVVNAEFSPDSVWRVWLHRSAPYADSIDWRQYIIRDAQVSIEDEAGSVEVLTHLQNGLYGSPVGNRPGPGQSYRLKVDAPSLPPVVATSSVPSLSASFVHIEEIQEPNDREGVGHYRVVLKLIDSPGDDRYAVHVEQLAFNCWNFDPFMGRHRVGESTDYRSIEFESTLPGLRDYALAVEDPAETLYLGEPYWGVAYMSDEYFEGQTVSIPLEIEAEYDADLEPHFRVGITRYSQELWEYEMSDERYAELGWSFFADKPVQLYTNIDNGLGIFAGSTTRSFRVD